MPAHVEPLIFCSPKYFILIINDVGSYFLDFLLLWTFVVEEKVNATCEFSVLDLVGRVLVNSAIFVKSFILIRKLWIG